MMMYYAKPPVSDWIASLSKERIAYLKVEYKDYEKPLYKAYCDEWGEE
ncbi:hypothetical protein [Arcobacter arenosus]|nr:hypothetical protein [Arcobacter arenosus]